MNINNPIEAHKFGQAHNALMDSFPNMRGDQGFMAACARCLAPFPIEVVLTTYHEAATSSRFAEWQLNAPKLVKLAEEIASLDSHMSAEGYARAWFAFIRAKAADMRAQGHTSLKSRYDDQAVQAVADCGGLVGILKGDGDAPEVRFVKAYCKLELQYQDGPCRPLKKGEDPEAPSSPRRGRVLKPRQLAASVAVSEAHIELGYQGSSRDVAGLMSGRMRP